MVSGIIDLLSLSQGGVAATPIAYVSTQYPLTMPNTQIKRTVFSAKNSVTVSRSPFTFQSKVQEHSGHLWSAEITLPLMKRPEAEPWASFLLQLNGQVGTFWLGPVVEKEPQGSVVGSPRVAGGDQTGQQLTTRGWAINTIDIVKAGDWFQLGSWLYKLTLDATSNNNGELTLDFWPRLRDVPPDDTQIIFQAPNGLFRLAGNEQVIVDVSEDHIFSISFSAIEAY